MFKALKEQPGLRDHKVLRADKAQLVLVFKERQEYRAL